MKTITLSNEDYKALCIALSQTVINLLVWSKKSTREENYEASETFLHDADENRRLLALLEAQE